MIETSLSAQLGTLPISVLYFNQFSGLFLFGNLVLIPASFFMICGGIISILLIILILIFQSIRGFSIILLLFKSIYLLVSKLQVYCERCLHQFIYRDFDWRYFICIETFIPKKI